MDGGPITPGRSGLHSLTAVASPHERFDGKHVPHLDDANGGGGRSSGPHHWIPLLARGLRYYRNRNLEEVDPFTVGDYLEDQR